MPFRPLESGWTGALASPATGEAIFTAFNNGWRKRKNQNAPFLLLSRAAMNHSRHTSFLVDCRWAGLGCIAYPMIKFLSGAVVKSVG